MKNIFDWHFCRNAYITIYNLNAIYIYIRLHLNIYTMNHIVLNNTHRVLNCIKERASRDCNIKMYRRRCR